jgi:hypothetical protein
MQVVKAEKFIQALLQCFAVIAVCMVLVAGASAGELIAEWNFNAESPNQKYANTGTGLASGYYLPLGSWGAPDPVAKMGSPADTNPVDRDGELQNSAAGRSGPLPGEASGVDGTRNITFQASTAGYHSPSISWHALQGYRASRYYQVYGSTDGGTTWNAVPTGVGSSATTLGSGSELSQSATVSNDGLITIITSDDLIPAGVNDNQATGDGFIYPLSYTFPKDTAYDNNPNFQVRIGAAHDPNGSDFVSSFAGTDSSDATSGYIRSSSEGGNAILYDLVSISGTVVPEPTGLLLAFCGLVLAGVAGRHRK